ncbi:MAG: hypothetical protein ACI8Q6_000327 [Granulosicoccus sp.]|jgi:hypothetical protein
MSERTKKFSDELDELITDGELVGSAMEHGCEPKQFRKVYLEVFKGDEGKLEKFIKKLPSFSTSYQKWYSKSQAIIKQVLPDRLSDFVSHYEFQRVRK